MKTHQDEKCCKASSPGRWSCRNKCDGPLECCSGGSGPRSRKSGWNSVPEKRLQLVPLLRWRQTLMKTVWSSDPVMRGLSLPSTKRSSSTGHLSFKISTFSNVSNAISVRFETLHWLTRIGFRRRRRFQISLVVRLARISPSVDRDLRLSFDTKYLCQKYLCKNKEIPLS